MTVPDNPYPADRPDRRQLWDMLVRRDIDAFVRGDWEAVADDFAAGGFMGLDAAGSLDPSSWRLSFPDVASYRASWLAQSRDARGWSGGDLLRDALFDASRLARIDIVGEAAIVEKVFDGAVPGADGPQRLDWTTIYQCRKANGRWRVCGFVGYLPRVGRPGKRRPDGARQHLTAGPYSPALIVDPDRLVVISGQAALAGSGQVVGEDIRSQARVTLGNCRQRLAECGCTLADVFKANVYLADLDDWPAFNEVYAAMVPEPRPVRTAVGARLLPGLLVEVEMWAATTRGAR